MYGRKLASETQRKQAGVWPSIGGKATQRNATPQAGATDARTPGFRCPRARTSPRYHTARKRRADPVGRDGGPSHPPGDRRRPPFRPLFRKDRARGVGRHSSGIPEASRESQERLAARAEQEAIRLKWKAEDPGSKNRNPGHPARGAMGGDPLGALTFRTLKWSHLALSG
jgi:hypothetical protein